MNQEPSDQAHYQSAGADTKADKPDDDTVLTPLHRDYVRVLRIQAIAITAPFVVGSLLLETARILPLGTFVIPIMIATLFIIIRLPMRRYSARGYSISEDRLRVVRGILFRSDTVVPFGRVQHIDVDEGPLERLYGLATLTLHTAGSHNASVHLPGLLHDDAVTMREAIRAHIKREAL